ncbi:hypothetical protein RRG08_003020 [Elysia crispata]|uniref:Uncharacterized protein n=1 Tax=Elysia crispata TaxID=231223 RepID=A0AAE1CM60_9GAST|nr:hypothetical protein RRG08_003020 [Elysia crispata]
MSLLPRGGSCRFYHAEVQDASTTRRFMSLLPEEVQVAPARGSSCRFYPRRFMSLLPRGGSSRFNRAEVHVASTRGGSCHFYHEEVQGACTRGGSCRFDPNRLMSLLPEEVQVASTRIGS